MPGVWAVRTRQCAAGLSTTRPAQTPEPPCCVTACGRHGTRSADRVHYPLSECALDVLSFYCCFAGRVHYPLSVSWGAKPPFQGGGRSLPFMGSLWGAAWVIGGEATYRETRGWGGGFRKAKSGTPGGEGQRRAVHCAFANSSAGSPGRGDGWRTCQSRRSLTSCWTR